MKPKNQRLILLSAALIAVLAAVLLAMWGLRDRASYFYTPADIVAGTAPEGQPSRLGGMVKPGSNVSSRIWSGARPDGRIRASLLILVWLLLALFVIAAKAGIPLFFAARVEGSGTPAFAGVTGVGRLTTSRQ